MYFTYSLHILNKAGFLTFNRFLNIRQVCQVDLAYSLSITLAITTKIQNTYKLYTKYSH